jgi:hypothetical protein
MRKYSGWNILGSWNTTGNASNGTNGRASISGRLNRSRSLLPRQDCPGKGEHPVHIMPQDGFTVGSDSHRYPKLMIAYCSRYSPAALQQRLQDWYERHNETFPQKLPGRVDPPEGGIYGDQLPLDKPRAKTLDITSGAGLPIRERCSSMDAEYVQDGQPDTGDV